MESLESSFSHAAERKRLAALAAYGVLGTPPEESFSRLARLAQRMFAVPGVLMSFFGERRVYYKAHIGLAQRSYPRAESLCASAAFADEALVFSDPQRRAAGVSLPLCGRTVCAFMPVCPFATRRA